MDLIRFWSDELKLSLIILLLFLKNIEEILFPVVINFQITRPYVPFFKFKKGQAKILRLTIDVKPILI
mgnify:FL=1